MVKKMIRERRDIIKIGYQRCFRVVNNFTLPNERDAQEIFCSPLSS
jgi:hypothetical protein